MSHLTRIYKETKLFGVIYTAVIQRFFFFLRATIIKLDQGRREGVGNRGSFSGPRALNYN
jgi:hypothetical protein